MKTQEQASKENLNILLDEFKEDVKAKKRLLNKFQKNSDKIDFDSSDVISLVVGKRLHVIYL